MGFIEEYKRLDNLCKDLLRSEKGVSSYIDSMEQYGCIQKKVQNWDYNYKQLKHYRYIRNQIAHENSANENNMSNENDESNSFNAIDIIITIIVVCIIISLAVLFTR